MDNVDRKIISLLEKDGRLSNVDLAAQVGLTPAPCLRRVKKLETDGVIMGYHAQINPQASQRGFDASVNVTLSTQDRKNMDKFEEAVLAFNEIVEIRRMFGTPDYILRVAVADQQAFEDFLTSDLMALPGIATVESHFTMKVITRGEERLS
ncbi:Lrp/AsnC family transcriptional regulator [Lysinibacter sp. HNR]|uniref:Lrp/AsnC family transcriptional regulator n=1 Tax=Lysinibacter sp. HNR TaxID=3031408 RepID=UPI00243493BC|nr:Lrp/AsnC family transcriptional regulator [Lysinibacter sp. HNR]WGD36588.1 Lrp/AsnC family transcriptional regulator [Lysinibacter sp. HNR]